MGRVRVLKAGLFIRKEIDHDFFSLHRNYEGFHVDKGFDHRIHRDSELCRFLAGNPRCHTMPELLSAVDNVAELKPFTILEPNLVVPLVAKETVQGIIIIADRFDGSAFDEGDKQFLIDMAALAALAVNNSFLFEVSTTDLMTKLKSRDVFFQALGTHMTYEKDVPLCVLMMDIDKFKNLNDTHGHGAGDVVLQEVANTVRQSKRKTDIAARYGGEEFALMLPNIDLGEARKIAERIRSRVESLHVFAGGHTITCTISVGLAKFNPNKDHEPQDLVNRADKALYASKDAGRNRVTQAP